MKVLLRTIVIIVFTLTLMPTRIGMAANTVRFRICDNLNGIMFDSKSYNNFCEKYINRIAAYMETNANIEESDLDDNITKLKNDEADFIFMINKSSQYEEALQYSEKPVCTGHIVLYTANGNTSYYYEDFENMSGIHIGFCDSSGLPVENSIKQYSDEHGFTASLQNYANNDELLKAFENNEVDAVAIPQIGAVDIGRVIGKCSAFNLYCAVKEGNEQLLNSLNKALERQETDSTFFMPSIYDECFGKPSTFLNGETREESEAAKQYKKIVLAVASTDYPMIYKNDNSLMVGVYTDILDCVSEKTNVTFYLKECKNIDEAMNMINSGMADGLLEAESNNDLYSTEPYIMLEYMPISYMGAVVDQDANLTVAIPKNSYSAVEYIKQKYKNWNIKEFETAEEALKAAGKGKVDCALINSMVLQTRINLSEYSNLSYITTFKVSVPISMGLNSKTISPGTISLLNKGIGSVSDNIKNDIVEEHIVRTTYVPTLHDILIKYQNIIIVIIMLMIFAVITETFRRGRKYKKIAVSDTLTGIWNMAIFEKECAKKIENSKDTDFYMVVLDLDNFKNINDTLGRKVGDQILQNIARNLKATFPESYCARGFGDHFYIFAEVSPQNMRKIILLPQMQFHTDSAMPISTSLKIGIYSIKSSDNNENKLSSSIERALIAKKKIKGHRTKNISVFSTAMEEELRMTGFVESEMEHALKNGQFVVYYQPKFNGATCKIIGAEALVRWIHPTKGLIGPNFFIPIFEKNGFIVELDFFVFEEVMKSIRQRMDTGHPVLPVSVNISRYHLHDVRFVDKFNELVKMYQIPKNLIELELTESVFADSDNMAADFMMQLKSYGYKISMDDFGSGYSSLNLLRELPIDILKIDKEFLNDEEEPERSRIIICNVVTMAKQLKINAICEGVETKEQLDFLLKAGCNIMQGFFFGGPMPKSEFEKLID